MLYVRPRKARNLVKKSVFRGGWLHSTATVHVSMAGQEKKSAQVDGSNPIFSDVIEFILGLSYLTIHALSWLPTSVDITTLQVSVLPIDTNGALCS